MQEFWGSNPGLGRLRVSQLQVPGGVGTPAIKGLGPAERHAGKFHPHQKTPPRRVAEMLRSLLKDGQIAQSRSEGLQSQNRNLAWLAKAACDRCSCWDPQKQESALLEHRGAGSGFLRNTCIYIYIYTHIYIYKSTGTSGRKRLSIQTYGKLLVLTGSLTTKWFQHEVCITFLGRGMCMNLTAHLWVWHVSLPRERVEPAAAQVAKVRKGGWYGWKSSSCSICSIRVVRAYPLVEISSISLSSDSRQQHLSQQ